jgi:hypothetical protein
MFSILIGTEPSPSAGAVEFCFFCSSIETGGEGGKRLVGCCTFATNWAGEFRSNCCNELLCPRVKRVAPGP